MSDNDDARNMEILYPAGTVSIMSLTYVHRVGFSVRSLGVPGSDPDQYLSTVDEILEYRPGMPVIFLFTGIWPDKQTIYQYVTGDEREATLIILDPTLLRTRGEQMSARFIPLDPISGSGELSMAEHNDWVQQLLPGATGSTMDWDALRSDASDVESFLSEMADRPDTTRFGGAMNKFYNNKKEEES